MQLRGFQVFGQQVGGLTDGVERIADFVRHTGGQPPQGGQFHLLHLLLHFFKIAQVNEAVALAVVLPLGVGMYTAITQHPPGRAKTLHHVAKVGSIALHHQRAIDVGQQHVAHQLRAKQLGGARIGTQHAPVRRDDDDTILHVFNNLFVDGFLTVKRLTAHQRQRGIFMHAPGKHPGNQRDHEKAEASHADLPEVAV